MLSVISVMEVIQGYQRVGGSRRIQAFRSAIASEEVLVFDQASADLAGQIVGDLDRVGRPIGRSDPMIAAVAITHGLELVTGNASNSSAIPSRWSTGGADAALEFQPVASGRAVLNLSPRRPPEQQPEHAPRPFPLESRPPNRSHPRRLLAHPVCV
jgi:hypothetical protein